MILAVMNAIYAIAYIEAWKIQDFNGVWTRDFAIPMRRSNQLSYEATDVVSWSFVGSNEPVRNECEVIMKYFIYNFTLNQKRRKSPQTLCNCVPGWVVVNARESLEVVIAMKLWRCL